MKKDFLHFKGKNEHLAIKYSDIQLVCRDTKKYDGFVILKDDKRIPLPKGPLFLERDSLVSQTHSAPFYYSLLDIFKTFFCSFIVAISFLLAYKLFF